MLADRPADGGAHSLAGKVDTVEPLGFTTLVRLQLRSDRWLNVLLTSKMRSDEGDSVYATFAPEHLYLFDRKSDRALRGIAG